MERLPSRRVPTTPAVIWLLLVLSCGTRDLEADTTLTLYLPCTYDKLSYVSSKSELVVSFLAKPVGLLDISLDMSQLPSAPQFPTCTKQKTKTL